MPKITNNFALHILTASIKLNGLSKIRKRKFP